MRLVFALALAAASMGGCAPHRDICAPVLQNIASLQGRLADVQRARAELAASGLRDTLPPAQRALYDRALEMLDEGYAVAVQATALAADACSEPDARGAIDMIVRAWDIIAPFIALIGGDGTPTIAAPIVWAEARP